MPSQGLPFVQPNRCPGTSDFPFRGTVAGEPFAPAYELFDKAVSAHNGGKLDEAIEGLRLALDRGLPSPEELAARALLAHSLMIKGSREQALEVLRLTLTGNAVKNIVVPPSPELLRRMRDTFAFIHSTLNRSISDTLPYKEEEERHNLKVDAKFGFHLMELELFSRWRTKGRSWWKLRQANNGLGRLLDMVWCWYRLR